MINIEIVVCNCCDMIYHFEDDELKDMGNRNDFDLIDNLKYFSEKQPFKLEITYCSEFDTPAFDGYLDCEYLSKSGGEND